MENKLSQNAALRSTSPPDANLIGRHAAAQKGSSPPPILEIHESHGTPGWVAHRAPEHRESQVGAELATVTMVQSITVMS